MHNLLVDGQLLLIKEVIEYINFMRVDEENRDTQEGPDLLRRLEALKKYLEATRLPE